jgi:hypothetical protein
MAQRKAWQQDRVSRYIGGHAIERNEYQGAVYFKGYVPTPHGYVAVYCEGLYGNKKTPVSTFDIILGGRCHTRTIERAWGPVYLARMARQFAREIAVRIQ